MGKIQSATNKKRWSKVAKKKRSQLMSDMAKFRWFMMSKEDKQKHAMKMVKAKRLKRNKLTDK